MTIPDKTPEASWQTPPSHIGTKQCVRCDKPTTSHAVTLQQNDRGEIEPATSERETDFIFPVCHSCFVDVDGDAHEIAREMTDSHSTLMEQAGVTPKMLSEFTRVESMDTEGRKQVFGDSPIGQMIPALEPGDVINVNDRFDAVIIPIQEEFLNEIDIDAVHTFVSLDDFSYAGGIMDVASGYELGYVADGEYFTEPIETVAYKGHNESVSDEMME